ncbi:MAG: ThuA domain-containing protein [Clostridiales bacterium]|jgi:type 1 glutamine amidotransferase|nr:ThuA domain-containing protein [Clostridiales bacterium]
MSKVKTLVLLNDYWHPRSSIEPAIPTIFPESQFEVTVTENPEDIGPGFDLIVNFKDGIANTQIPTPNWYEGPLDGLIADLVLGGCGYFGIHCGIANVPKESRVFTDILKGRFLNHPPACPVYFEPAEGHPLTDGAKAFDVTDEHYNVEVLSKETSVLGWSRSSHGKFPALWAHKAGKGKVCAVTPGHTLEVLLNPEYSKLLRNAALWCAGKL